MPYDHLWLIERILRVGEVSTKGVDGRKRQIRPCCQVASGSTDRADPASTSAFGRSMVMNRLTTDLRPQLLPTKPNSGLDLPDH